MSEEERIAMVVKLAGSLTKLATMMAREPKEFITNSGAAHDACMILREISAILRDMHRE